MWQGKSLIPRPRLSTPRRTERTKRSLFNHTITPSRTPSHTPSRFPRWSSNVAEETTAEQPRTSATTSSQTHPHHARMSLPIANSRRQIKPSTNRGDTLAEHVIASGILATDTAQSTSQHYGSAYRSKELNDFSISHRDFEEKHLPRNELSYEPSLGNSVLDSPHNSDRTPPEKIRSSQIPRNDTYSSEFGLVTPERGTERGRRDQLNNDKNDLVIDEELVTRTPAKHKNSEWLEGFGIDISLLKIADNEADEENHDPNVTPSPVYGTNKSNVRDFNSRKSTTSFSAFRSRRATDFYGYAQSNYENLSYEPTRVASARKTRRASARISARELDALKFNNNFETESKKADVGTNIPKGSDVFLTPVRASRRQREKNGTPLVLSEVRRSLRINNPSSELVPRNSVRGRIELLEANDHSYIPNPTLSERA